MGRDGMREPSGSQFYPMTRSHPSFPIGFPRREPLDLRLRDRVRGALTLLLSLLAASVAMIALLQGDRVMSKRTSRLAKTNHGNVEHEP